MESTDFLVIGCGPAGAIAAREAAASGVETVVLERDRVVGAKRVCAAGLRPGFCDVFGVPRAIVHCDPPLIALHAPSGRRYDFRVGPAHTTTREELDGTLGELARAAGAQIRTSAHVRSWEAAADGVVVEYADLERAERRRIGARNVFFATGATARFERTPFAYEPWDAALVTCYQYRVYLERPAVPQTYVTLEMHYYRTRAGRPVIAWMFPKRDHLSIGLGIQAKLPGAELRAELNAFLPTVLERLAPGVPYAIREEGNLLYGGAPRPRIADGAVMVGGSAAGLVDATTGEGIHEAAMTGRYAADAVVRGRKTGEAPATRYVRATTRAFYGRLRHRHKLMQFLERRPARFDVLFHQLETTPKFAELLQHDRNDFTQLQWLYLTMQAAKFSLRAVRA